MRHTWIRKELRARIITRTTTTDDIPETGWWHHAACKGMDTEIWFPGHGYDTRWNRARKICMQCPVRTLCLNDAIKHNDEYGMFGGLTPTERKEAR